MKNILRDLNGKTLEERQEYMMSILGSYSPKKDIDGNIFIGKGSGDYKIFVSTHMDCVDENNRYNYSMKNNKVKGLLDNALGVAIAIDFINNVDPMYQTMFCFTSVEEDKTPTFNGGFHSAMHLLEPINDQLAHSDLAIVIDVSPRIDHHKQDIYCNFSGFGKDDHHIKKEIMSYKNVGFSDRPILSEARIYSRLFPTITTGPGVIGHIHDVSEVDYKTLNKSRDFVKYILTTNLFD